MVHEISRPVIGLKAWRGFKLLSFSDMVGQRFELVFFEIVITVVIKMNRLFSERPQVIM